MNKNRKIYLVRHCRPELPGMASICLGRKDLILSDAGIKHAEKLRSVFATLNIERIYSSPLKRALKTAEIISNGSIDYDIIKGFTELDVGKWDGMPFNQIKDEYPQEYIERGKNFENYVIEGGESILACKKRSFLALNEALNKSSGDIVIVSHAGVIRFILAEILGLTIKESFLFKLKYGSISILWSTGNKLEVSKIGLETGYFFSEEERLNE